MKIEILGVGRVGLEAATLTAADPLPVCMGTALSREAGQRQAVWQYLVSV